MGNPRLSGADVIIVRKSSVQEITHNPNFEAVAEEYRAECAHAGLPDPQEKLSLYFTLESSGVFHPYAAFKDGRLIGFMALFTAKIPHYGYAMAVTESLFVAAAERHTGAGTRLIRAAERHARAVGCPAILITAPVSGKLSQVLPKMKYAPTNTVFMKKLPH
jgi:GNAT superfamily N-acetyltransferase